MLHTFSPLCKNNAFCIGSNMAYSGQLLLGMLHTIHLPNPYAALSCKRPSAAWRVLCSNVGSCHTPLAHKPHYGYDSDIEQQMEGIKCCLVTTNSGCV